MGATLLKKTQKAVKLKSKTTTINREQLLSFYTNSEFATTLGEITAAKAAVRYYRPSTMAGEWAEQSDYVSAFANLRLGKRYRVPTNVNETSAQLQVVRGPGRAPLCAEHLIACLNN